MELLVQPCLASDTSAKRRHKRYGYCISFCCVTTMPLPSFIDIEASGFGASSYPIEVGCVLPDGASYCSLITPLPHWQHWDDKAELIHGIQRPLLFQHGRSANEVAASLNACLRGLTVYTDSWYHDYTWLSRLFDAADASPYFTLQDLRTLLQQDEADQWEAAKAAVIAELQLTRHRASNDARVLQCTLLRVGAITPAHTPSNQFVSGLA